jgi:hypothetical protein
MAKAMLDPMADSGSNGSLSYYGSETDEKKSDHEEAQA